MGIFGPGLFSDSANKVTVLYSTNEEQPLFPDITAEGEITMANRMQETIQDVVIDMIRNPMEKERQSALLRSFIEGNQPIDKNISLVNEINSSFSIKVAYETLSEDYSFFYRLGKALENGLVLTQLMIIPNDENLFAVSDGLKYSTSLQIFVVGLWELSAIGLSELAKILFINKSIKDLLLNYAVNVTNSVMTDFIAAFSSNTVLTECAFNQFTFNSSTMETEPLIKELQEIKRVKNLTYSFHTNRPTGMLEILLLFNDEELHQYHEGGLSEGGGLLTLVV
jgi:hypothetical protein